ncbi:MAG: M48 family metalloprotease [FCB group bacterium]|jgi:predicted Zn-dependent protease|nr:M48 family metalloprotease [FCB group bacterium]
MAYSFRGRRGGGGGSLKIRLFIALIVAGGALLSYYGTREYNPITDEVQHVDLSVDQEIALGLQAAPEMAAQYGGQAPDPQAQARVDRVGQRLLERSTAKDSPYRFEFHVLADENTINAFALPGGQVFITNALLKQLETEGQLAGVLGHEMGHVVARHGAQHLAKAKLTQGLTGAAVIATYDPNNPRSANTAAVAAMIGQLVNLRYGREDELESDRLGVRFTSEAGYNPSAMIRVMEILAKAGERRGGQPEFFSTHPNPDRRVERIQAAISERFPQGIPSELEN